MISGRLPKHTTPYSFLLPSYSFPQVFEPLKSKTKPEQIATQNLLFFFHNSILRNSVKNKINQSIQFVYSIFLSFFSAYLKLLSLLGDDVAKLLFDVPKSFIGIARGEQFAIWG